MIINYCQCVTTFFSCHIRIPHNSYRIYNSVLFNYYTAGARLGDDDHSSIYNKPEDKLAVKWKDIGKELGFKEGEMDNIQGNAMLLLQLPPKSYLRDVLSQWLQRAPGMGVAVLVMPLRSHYVLHS